ncbi:MAG TPA: hypothetical protein VFQ41_25095 [Candidatus Angelobacter sp.]|nr:hypothetical protein [Candidatus Angelobacter sp.]
MKTNEPDNFEMYDRSHRFAEVVQATGSGAIRLSLTIDREIAGTETAQLIALAICNILPRISERYTSIDLCIPNQAVRIPRIHWQGTLQDYLLTELNAICPWGTFRAVERLIEVYDHCIVVGSTTPLSANHAVYALASGWRCFVSETASRVLPALAFNPSSCLATAAMACMFVYRQAEKIQSWVQQPEINGWSLLTYKESPHDGPSLPEDLNIHEVRQAGVGGTGNALLWALRHGPDLIGRWIAFEHEAADVTNWNRYMLLNFNDAAQGKTKAEVAAQAFEKIHAGLKFGAMPGRVEDCYHDFRRAAVVLATVDDPKVRVDLQPYSTNVLLNVGTNSQCLSISVHETQKVINGNACIGCLYGQNGQAERRQRESTVSFVLGLVGAVLSGEFIKSYAFPEHLLSNSWGANIFYPASAKIVQAEKVPQCSVCTLLGKMNREVSPVKKPIHIAPRTEAPCTTTEAT